MALIRKYFELTQEHQKEKSECGGSNLWSVYNTMTNYSTHVDNQDWTGTELNENGDIIKSSLIGAKHNVKYNRELEVAKSLNHPLFKMVA